MGWGCGAAGWGGRGLEVGKGEERAWPGLPINCNLLLVGVEQSGIDVRGHSQQRDNESEHGIHCVEWARCAHRSS